MNNKWLVVYKDGNTEIVEAKYVSDAAMMLDSERYVQLITLVDVD